jgi:hypothetical protein
VVPYKLSSEFELMIDYKFQDRPFIDRTKEVYDVSEKGKRADSGPLPFLTLKLKLLKLSDEEVKVRIVNSAGNMIINHKANEDMAVSFDVGFIDDVKDRISPHEFTILLYSSSKKVTSRIHLLIMEDGTFMVNNEKKGKF